MGLAEGLAWKRALLTAHRALALMWSTRVLHFPGFALGSPALHPLLLYLEKVVPQ
jgi:hypothetical protein